jgi:hypothetical protein
MPTRRTPIGRHARSRITPQAAALFRLCLEIQETGCDQFLEEDGGRRREFLDAHSDLGRLLGLAPWEASPLDVPDEGPCPWAGSGNCYAASWPQAQEIRAALKNAISF